MGHTVCCIGPGVFEGYACEVKGVLWHWVGAMLQGRCVHKRLLAACDRLAPCKRMHVGDVCFDGSCRTFWLDETLAARGEVMAPPTVTVELLSITAVMAQTCLVAASLAACAPLRRTANARKQSIDAFMLSGLWFHTPREGDCDGVWVEPVEKLLLLENVCRMWNEPRYAIS